MDEKTNVRYFASKVSTGEKRFFKNMKDLDTKEFETDCNRKFAEDYLSANDESLLEAEIMGIEIPTDSLWVFGSEEKADAITGVSSPRYFAFSVNAEGNIYGVCVGLKSPKGALISAENKRLDKSHVTRAVDREKEENKQEYTLALNLWRKVKELQAKRADKRNKK